MPSYTDAERLSILREVQEGNLVNVMKLYNANNELLLATSKSKQSTLLHVAAERGHYDICLFLLEKGHATNPVDIAGLTPYSRATDVNIKKLLVERHKQYLVSRYYVAELNGISLSADIRTQVLTREMFVRVLAQKGMLGRERYHALTGINSKDMSIPIITTFREDLLMVPIYGEIMAILEHRQAITLSELKDRVKAEEDLEKREKIISEAFVKTDRSEVVAYFTALARIYEVYPVLLEVFPNPRDRVEEAEAKKMIIAFLINGINLFLSRVSSSEDIAYLRQQIPSEKIVIVYRIIGLIADCDQEHIESIGREMAEKYIKPMFKEDVVRKLAIK